MELRYFVVIAEDGSLTNAAERRLHTAQPSLSRQIRDLELEVSVTLLERKPGALRSLRPLNALFRKPEKTDSHVSSNRLGNEQQVRGQDERESPRAGGLRTHVIGAGNQKVMVQAEIAIFHQ